MRQEHLIRNIRGGSADTLAKIAASAAQPKVRDTPRKLVQAAARQVFLALKGAAAEDPDATRIEVVFTARSGSSGKDKSLNIGLSFLSDVLAAATTEVATLSGSFSRSVLTMSRDPRNRYRVTFCADISKGDHPLQDLDADRFKPRQRIG